MTGQCNLTRSLGAFAGSVALAVMATGCGNGSNEIREERIVRAETPYTQEASTAERFGFRQRPVTSAPASTPPGYRWAAPAAWQEEPAAPLRPANFSTGPNGSIEVYLSVLGGTGGGLEANVNRWRGQMSLPPLSAGEVGALPTAEVLGQQATLIDFEGHYGGMSGESDVASARMLGAILMDGDSAVFVKMVGPGDEVAGELEHFNAFLASLERAAPQHAHAGHQHGDEGWVHPPMGDDSGWQHPPIDGGEGWVHPPINGSAGFQHPPIPEGAAIMSESSFQSERPGGLRWQAPESWNQGPDRPVRLVTYMTGPASEVETYVTILSGTAGGVSANINRWREEMGQGRLSSSEIGALPELEVLGGTAKLVEVAGNYAGKTGGNMERAKLLGLIVPLETQVVFVRMTGPQDVVQAERDNFIRFCESFRFSEEAK